MRVIKLSAYLNLNVGDDLMVELLMQHYPKYYFWDCIPDQNKPISFERYRFFNNQDIIKKYRIINSLLNRLLFIKKKDIFINFVFNRLEKKCICGVAIGGSIFKPLKGESIEQRIKRENKKKAKNKPFYIISANFGPYKDPSFFDGFFVFFKGCNGVSFRDKLSYNLFSDLPQVQYAPDIVFNLSERKMIDNNMVLISVIDFAIRPHLAQYEENYIEKIKEICQWIVQKNRIPVLVSFCNAEGDALMIKKVRSRLDSNTNEVTKEFHYIGNTNEIVQLFCDSCFVIATRFHSMVLGMRFKKPMFSISYELKMENVLFDSGITAFCDIRKISEISVEDMFSQGNSVFVDSKYISIAKNQFKQLDMLLK